MSDPYRVRREVGRHVRPSTPDKTATLPVSIEQSGGETVAVADAGTADPRTPDNAQTNITVHARSGLGQLTADLQVHSLLEELIEEVRMLRSLSEEVLRRKD